MFVMYIMEENERKSYPTFKKVEKRLKIEFAIRGFDYSKANRQWNDKGNKLVIVPQEKNIHFVIQKEN